MMPFGRSGDDQFTPMMKMMQKERTVKTDRGSRQRETRDDRLSTTED